MRGWWGRVSVWEGAGLQGSSSSRSVMSVALALCMSASGASMVWRKAAIHERHCGGFEQFCCGVSQGGCTCCSAKVWVLSQAQEGISCAEGPLAGLQSARGPRDCCRPGPGYWGQAKLSHEGFLAGDGRGQVLVGLVDLTYKARDFRAIL